MLTPAKISLQILLNFLQVTSIAVSINVEWRQEVQDMLSLQGKLILLLDVILYSHFLNLALSIACSCCITTWRF